MALDAATVRAVNAYIASDQGTRASVINYIERAWTSLADYRDADIDRFVARVVPNVLAGERRIADLTNSYLAQYASHVTGGKYTPAKLNLADVTGTALRGVDPTEVYRRPAVTMRTALSNGTSFREAVAQGLQRAKSLGATDLQLAKTHTARSILSRDDRVVGFRRVLKGGKTCGLCAVASTQRYHKERLQPIHPGCGCGVQPIYGDRDPGQVIDPERLEGVHAAIQGRFGVSDRGGRDAIDYRNVLVTNNHGEIGPVLGVRGQAFTSEADLRSG